MLKAKWLGHSCWLLEGSARVLIDPFLDDNPKAPIKASEIGPIDVVAITHDHFDHIADAGPILQASGATAVATYEVANALASSHNAKTEGMNIGGSVSVGPVTCHMTQAFHTAERGAATGFVIELDGVRVYHTGDTCVFGDMALIGELLRPDLMLCPIGDRFTMGPRSAAHAVGLVRPRTVIPMHYGTWPPIEQDPETFRRYVQASAPDVEVVILEPGGHYEIGARNTAASA